MLLFVNFDRNSYVSSFYFQATVYLLSKLEIVLAKSPPEEIKSEVLPLVFNTLDTNSLQLQVMEKVMYTVL